MTNKIKLSDYTQPSYWTSKIELEVEIRESITRVICTSHFKKNGQSKQEELILNGHELKLLCLSVNDKEFDYKLDQEGNLILDGLPDIFTLKTEVEIDPSKNFSGEGFYFSGDIMCTQCEAEGFRRITYHQDRPDVMSSYQTKIIADKKKYPYLLSNGDLVESGDLANGKHFALWVDPHKKPSYLFAMVAGDLEKVEGDFTTKSGRKIALEFFVDHGNGDKCGHALKSLQKAMKWDEERFGLEYDLDTYMVVAVDSFNMGAMENKGLNIFNSAYVLARPDTATDSDFMGIESVIGHEYFHNWTGNRVTCRDWFQLTLKEGLTVFRDQEFSADLNSRAVQRVDDVKRLKTAQFPEDAGPLSHPIKPKAYAEINNFYTATIYEKGAEVIRMIHTLIGEESFRKGMDLYFERFDGMAVTTEDFVQAMADASEKDLTSFKNWYDQNGTPVVNIATNYKDEKFHALLTHETNFNSKKNSLHFPFHYTLYGKDGSILHQDKTFEVDKNPLSIEVKGIKEKPIVSWNEGFSAPVKFNVKYSFEELSILMEHCQDDYNRFEFAQQAVIKQIEELMLRSRKSLELECNTSFLTAYERILDDHELDPALKAYAVHIPNLKEFNDTQDKFEFYHTNIALDFLKVTIADNLKEKLFSLARDFHHEGAFQLDGESIGKRALKLQCLKLLSKSADSTVFDYVFNIFENANNMTDEIGALSILSFQPNKYREIAIQKFYEKWKHETLVIQKWLMVQALAPDTTIQKIEELEESDIYNSKVPNLLRSLLGSFIVQNVENLHAEDGSGYKFACRKIAEVDRYNPLVAARLAKGLGSKAKLDPARRGLLIESLSGLKSEDGLSKDTLEVVTGNLA